MVVEDGRPTAFRLTSTKLGNPEFTSIALTKR